MIINVNGIEMNKITNLKVIAFDAMGVILIDPDDIKDILLPYVQELKEQITLQDVRKWYFQLSKGQMESKNFWKQYFDEEMYPKIEDDFIKRLKLDPAFLQILPKLKGKYQIALLSNDVHEWSKGWREYYNLEHAFDTTIVSGDPDVKVRKPDKQIYQKLMQQFDYKAHNFLFIDDRLRNLKPAAELGMLTVLMDKFPQDYPYQADFTIKKLEDLLNII